MKINILVLLIILTVQITACSKAPKDFEMTVNEVVELKGFILKGISISGKVNEGCIANEDDFIVKRDGKQILVTSTRILNVQGLEDPESFTGETRKGDYVTLYIPDGKKDDVKIGDVLSSKETSCNKDVST